MHTVVNLDSIPIPPLDFPHELIHYKEGTTLAQAAARLKDATILIDTTVRLSYDMLMHHAPKLQFIGGLGTGVDHIDHDAVRERGLTLCNVPATNIEAVTEHAFALLFALKRRIVPLHALTMAGEVWKVKKAGVYADFRPPPRVNGEEVLGVIGYGGLGKSVEKMARALGMKVLIADRKGATEVRDGRVAFETALKECTVFILVCPLDVSTRNMIDEAEFNTMQPTSMIVNVGRGGIINEQALTAALRKGKISGAATDVFETEPATKENSPLLDPSIPNLVLSPHMAWYSAKSINGSLMGIKSNIEAWVAGKPQNVILGGNVSNGSL